MNETDEMVEAACAVYAKATGYYVEFHRGLRSESADKMRLGMRAALTFVLQRNSGNMTVSGPYHYESDITHHFGSMRPTGSWRRSLLLTVTSMLRKLWPIHSQPSPPGPSPHANRPGLRRAQENER